MKSTSLTTFYRRFHLLWMGLTIGVVLLLALGLMLASSAQFPVRADLNILYVDGASGADTGNCTSGSTPCASVGYALQQTIDGDEIRVAEGTYSESISIATRVRLKGGYEAGTWTQDITSYRTILDGTGSSSSVILIQGVGYAYVEGLTIQGGGGEAGGGVQIRNATVVISGTVIQNNSAEEAGGGILVDAEGGDAYITVTNSSLLYNTTDGPGGGLAARNIDGDGTISLNNVEVRGNTAQSGGGGLYSEGFMDIVDSEVVSNTTYERGGGILAHELTLRNSDVSYNQIDSTGGAYGGGISGRAGAGRSYLKILGSTVRHNQLQGEETLGGGIDGEMSDITIIDSIVSDNEGSVGGMTMYLSVFTITNSLFVDNKGSGISGGESSGTIVNLTSANNSWGGLHLGGSNIATVTNSVLWGNGPASDYHCDGDCNLSYSLIGNEEPAGTGNIYDVDPRFVDANAGDYHLSTFSPCIDRGTSVGAPATDLEGTPRDIPDMGAYEWTGVRLFLPLVLKES